MTEEKIKRYTNEEIEAIYSVKNRKLPDDLIAQAKEVNIMDYIEKKGLMVEKSSRGTYQLVEHDSLKITPSENAFKWWSRDEGGYGAIKFATVYYDMDFRAAVRDVVESAGEYIEPIKAREKVVEEKEPFKYDPRMFDKDTGRSEKYLVEDRKINPDLVEKLIDKGMIRQITNEYDNGKGNKMKFNNVAFMWQRQGEIIGFEERGASQKSSYKGIAEGVPENRGFSVTFGKPKSLFVFESSIDALSYASMYQPVDSRFISMNGLKQRTMWQAMKDIENDTGSLPEHVVICTDNDSPGRHFAEKYCRPIEGSGKQINMFISEPPKVVLEKVKERQDIKQLIETLEKYDGLENELQVKAEGLLIERDELGIWTFKSENSELKLSESSNEKELDAAKHTLKDHDFEVSYSKTTKDWNEVLIECTAKNKSIERPLFQLDSNEMLEKFKKNERKIAKDKGIKPER